MARRKSKLPFDLADLRAHGVTRLRYKDGAIEVEMDLAPVTARTQVKDAFAAPWVDGEAEGDDGPEPEDEGDPRFLLERIATANSKAGRAV